mgnify:CR=1 FL=1
MEKFIYLLPYLFSLAITLSISIYTWQHRQVVGAKPYFVMTLSQSFVIFASIFELAQTELNTKIFWDNVQWLGALIIPIAFLIFALEYSNKPISNKRQLLGKLLIIPILFLLLVGTNRFHGLTLSNPRLISGYPFSALTYDFTPIVWLTTLYLYTLILISIFILIRQFRHAQNLFRKQTGIIIIGLLIPLIGSVISILELAFFLQRDVTPIAMAVGNLVVAWGLFRYQIFDLVMIGRDTVMENLPDIVIVVDDKNRIIDLNPVALERLNEPKTAIIGKTIHKVFANYPELVTHLNNKEPVHTFIELETTNGTLYYELITSPIYNLNQQEIGRVIIARDIKEQKQAEKGQQVLLNLAQAVSITTNLQDLLTYIHQQLGTLIDTTNFYVALYDENSKQYSFPYWTDERDANPEQWQPKLLPQSFTDYVRRSGKPLLANWGVQHQLVAQGEIALNDDPSDLWLGAPLITPDGIIGVIVLQSYHDPELYTNKDLEFLSFTSDKIALAIERKTREEALEKYRNHLEELVDKRTMQLAQKNDELKREIVERKLIEQELQAHTQELERSNRELRDFTYISSHDLQEPLRKIQTFSDRLQYKYDNMLDEQGKNYLARMQMAATHSQNLIADLLTYSRVSATETEVEEIDLTLIAIDMLERLASQIESQKAKVHIGQLPMIIANKAQIEQLFHHLVDNALKFQPTGQSPYIEIVEIKNSEVGDRFCRLAFIDNGIGFKERYLDRIFTVFQRLHKNDEYEGTGIGLAICRRITELHNGRIWATSTPNKGSTFFVELPKVQ